MKRNIFLWALYDFSNSIIMIVFLFYFSQWLTIDRAKPDWWFNTSLIVASALFLFTAPFLTRKLDITQKKLSGLRTSSAILTFLYLLTALIMLFIPEQTLIATIFFTLATYVYTLSFLYYTPMINDLSDETNRGYVSGIGGGANYIGQVFGIFISLPFVNGTIYLFGESGRAQTLLPAILLFILFGLPLFLFYKEPELIKREGNLNIFQTFKKIFTIPNLVLIFTAYFLFSDALLTFSNNFPIFLEKVYKVTDSTKSYLSATILILSIFGSIIFGKVSDKYGTKNTLISLLVVWLILFPLIAFSASFTMLVIICIIAGFFFGPVWAVSRAMVAENTPREIESSSFGFYILAERFATFIGPIIWSVVLSSTAYKGSISYSYAIISMAGLILVSIFFVMKVNKINQSIDMV